MKRNRLTSNVPLRLNIFVKVGFNKTKPLFDNAFNITAPFADITDNLLAALSAFQNGFRRIS